MEQDGSVYRVVLYSLEASAPGNFSYTDTETPFPEYDLHRYINTGNCLILSRRVGCTGLQGSSRYGKVVKSKKK